MHSEKHEESAPLLPDIGNLNGIPQDFIQKKDKPATYNDQFKKPILIRYWDSTKWLVVLLVGGILLFDRGIWNGSGNRLIKSGASPHIVMFLADDQGYNDIGYQSTDLDKCTPFLDSLATNGIKLRWHYGNHVCTPARAALLTGMYNVHLGMGHKLVTGSHIYGLPLDVTTMPQLMKQAGYHSIMLGKWHLGHYSHHHLPTRRGFDTFFGFYSGFQDHFTHIAEPTLCDENCFFDLRLDNATVDTSSLPDAAAYGPNLWRNEAMDFIERYDDSIPLFMYYAESLVHTPCEAPEFIFSDYANILVNIPNTDRRTFAAMTIYLDLVLQNLTNALQSKGMWDNTVLIYASDNGGDPTASGSGNNMPLRGRKSNLFEGGIRVPAFVHSRLLPDSVKHSNYDYMFHICDWLPTIVHGIVDRSDLLEDLNLDGVNHWTRMLEGSDSLTEKRYPSKAPRHEILIGIDYLDAEDVWVGYDTAAVIVGYDKLITNEVNETWWPTPGEDTVTRSPLELTSETPVYTYLFNLRDDPEEKFDLSLVYPDRVDQMKSVLASYRTSLVNSLYCTDTDHSAADTVQSVGGFVTPWSTDSVTCPLRILSDGAIEKDYYPSYLDGGAPSHR